MFAVQACSTSSFLSQVSSSQASVQRSLNCCPRRQNSSEFAASPNPSPNNTEQETWGDTAENKEAPPFPVETSEVVYLFFNCFNLDRLLVENQSLNSSLACQSTLHVPSCSPKQGRSDKPPRCPGGTQLRWWRNKLQIPRSCTYM